MATQDGKTRGVGREKKIVPKEEKQSHYWIGQQIQAS